MNISVYIYIYIHIHITLYSHCFMTLCIEHDSMTKQNQIKSEHLQTFKFLDSRLSMRINIQFSQKHDVS